MPHLTARDGTRLYYERHGETGDPLLLIMGLGGTIDFWQLQTPVFARAHQVAVYDNRGMGASDQPSTPYDIALLADDALQILDGVGFARAHVVGISMGGMIAQELALRHPDRVGSLVLACTYAKPDEDARTTAAGMRQAGGLAGVEPKQLFKAMMGLVLTPEFIARERQWLRAIRDKTLETFVLDAFVAQLTAAMGHDSTAELQRIDTPTLVLTGTQDKLIPPASSDVLAQLIPGAKLVKLDGGSHGFNVEMPDRFNAEILQFLARHPLDAQRF